jgi:CDP-diacylglycerol--glycerol-3-phosphate 3-phosphatidyltransferase
MTPTSGDGGLAIPRRLSRIVTTAGAAGVVILIAAAAVIPTENAALFVFGGAFLWIAFATTLWRRRALNVPTTGSNLDPGDTLGAATFLTLGRALLLCVLAGLLLAPLSPDQAPWLPGALYTLAAIGDGVDGALARRLGRTTKLGASLDVTTDAVGLFVAPLLAVGQGRLPPWYLLLSAAYPLFQAGVWLRVRLRLPTHPEGVRPYPLARLFAGAQMVVVAAALFPWLPRLLLWPLASVVMLPTLVLFTREWRLVTAASGAAAETAAEFQHTAGGIGPGAQR